MLKKGPTISKLTNELTNAPRRNTPLVSAPKTAPETPNIVNIPVIIADTTTAISTVIIIKPK